MRFKLHMQLAGNRQILPLNYQYPISAWIYRVMANADNEFTRALHESGYKIENGKSFKLFTFSKLSFPRHTTRLISGTDRMEVWARNAWPNVAFQLPDQC
jgi:CRISPR-associated endoribonuclease Cas6